MTALKETDTAHLEDICKKVVNKNIPHFAMTAVNSSDVPKGSITVLALFGQDAILRTISDTLDLL